MKKQKIILKNYCVLKAPIQKEDKIKEIFTIYNPEYLDLCKRRRLSKSKRPKGYILSRYKENNKWKTKKFPEFIYYYHKKDGNLYVPRGGLFELEKFYKSNQIEYKIINKRKSGKFQNFVFNGDLKKKKGQLSILNHNADNGIIKSSTGSGKTVMSLYLTAKINKPTVIAVNTIELLNQWKEQIKKFLKVKPGTIGNGQETIRPITVALIQSLKDKTNLLKHFGLLIVDEVHFVATESYGKIINKFNGKYVIGLSATPKRKDGKTQVMFWYCGLIETDIKYENSERTHCKIKFIPTEFKAKHSFIKSYSKALNDLKFNKKRNKLIINTVLENIEIFGVHLILSNSSKHLYELFNLLPDHIKLISKVLVGTVNKKDRKQIVYDMSKGKLKLIFATQQLLGTGFDESLLSILHLGTPIKDTDKLTQYIGRITRIHTDKKESFIFDYFDKYEKVLKNQTNLRSKLYKKLKIERIN